MDYNQQVLFFTFITLFIMLIWGKWRYDILAFTALIFVVLMGVIPVEKAYLGFGHPATIIVALVLIISVGLENSGAVHYLTKIFIKNTKSVFTHITKLGAIGALLSGFMNNVATLALLMPVDIQSAKKNKWSARSTLMPLSFATILGGMVTLIGTPPNIIISSIRYDYIGESFSMFDFAPVGGIVATVGLFFLVLVGWRFIPKSKDNTNSSSDNLIESSKYISELVVPSDSNQVGKKVLDLLNQIEESGVSLLGMIRDGEKKYDFPESLILKEKDILILHSLPDSLEELRILLNLDYTNVKKSPIDYESEGFVLTEVVVTDNSRLVGKSAYKVGLGWRKQTIILGISRQGKRIIRQVRKTNLKVGDILLLLVKEDSIMDVTSWMGCLLLEDRKVVVTKAKKLFFASFSFFLAIFLASIGFLHLTVALSIVAIIYVFSKIISLNEVYDKVQWPIIILLGSMIPLGTAFEESGGTNLLSDLLLSFSQGWPDWLILTLLMCITMTLSDVLNNTATAIIFGPIAIKIADSLNANPDPFLMAVAISASCAFLTPIGHKNNAIIMGPGGYSFSDYWKLGLPLEIIIITSSVPLILFFWPI